MKRLADWEIDKVRQLLNGVGPKGVAFNDRTLDRLFVNGGDIIDGSLVATALTKGVQNFSSNIVFTAPSNTQVNWTSGTITFSDSTSYAISSGNTGAMAALTYIYFDPTVSATVLQVTTNFALVTTDTATLLCVAKNIADAAQTAFFIPAIGLFGINNTVVGPSSISTSNIQALAITTGLLAANSVTAAKISVAQLDAISVNAGTITAGTFIGTTFKTANSGARVEMNVSQGLIGNDGSQNTFQLDTVGNLKVMTVNPISNAFGTIVYGGSSGGLTLGNYNGGTSVLSMPASGFVNFGLPNGATFSILINAATVLTVAGTLITAGSGVSFRTTMGSSQGLQFDGTTSIYGAAANDIRLYCNGDRFRVTTSDTYMGTRNAASVAANFSADYYVPMKDILGNTYYLPAKGASW